MNDTENSEPPSTTCPASGRFRAGPVSRTAHIDLIDPSQSLSVSDTGFLVDRATACLDFLGVTGEVRVRIVGDADMCRLHGEHSGDPTTTDILTFDLADPPDPAENDPPHLDADLVLCIDVAARQAALRGHGVAHELLLYAVHGVLHCLGYDDHDEAEFAAMHTREDEILRSIGVGTVFAPPDLCGSSQAKGGAT